MTKKRDRDDLPCLHRYFSSVHDTWLWRCTRLAFRDVVGYGSTPFEAYANWNWKRLA